MTFYNAIRKWVGKNYGTQEMEDPSWDIKALADYLSHIDIDTDELNSITKNSVYDELRTHYLREDIESIADERGYKLTEKHIANIMHQYYKLDDETWEQLASIMDDLDLPKADSVTSELDELLEDNSLS